LRFAAYEDSGKMIGHRVVPVVGLRPGYRHIPLKNESGQPLMMASLFVHVTVKDYVPEEFSDIADALSNPIAYQSAAERRAKLLEQVEQEDDHLRSASQASGRISASTVIHSMDSVESTLVSSTPPPTEPSTQSVTASSSIHKNNNHDKHSQQHSQEGSSTRPPLVHQGSKSAYMLSSLLNTMAGKKKHKEKDQTKEGKPKM